MTRKTEDYIINGIDEIIKTAKNSKEVWKIVHQKFGDIGTDYLDDMGYPYPGDGIIIDEE